MTVLAIDFDGVVHDHKNPVKGRRMGGPMSGAREALTRHHLRGDRIIIHTVWGDERGKKVIADWMRYYVIPYDEITNIKPDADVYLDDKAVRFTTWEVFERTPPGVLNEGD